MAVGLRGRRAGLLHAVAVLGRLLGSFVAGVGSLALMGAVAAPPAGADTEIEVEAGVDGYAVRGEPIPVHVRVDSDRLFDGELVVAASGGTGRVSVRRPLELAGGAAKDLEVVVPSSPWELPVLSVSLHQDDQVVARDTVRLDGVGSPQLVGVLPVLAGLTGELPPTSEMAVGDRLAHLGPLRPAQLDLGSDAIALFDVVAGVGTDLAELSDEQRATLFHWVASGGTLLLDDGAESTPVGLPSGWEPGSLGHARAGSGEVRVTGGRAAAGAWEEILYPTPQVPDPDRTQLWIDDVMVDPTLLGVEPVLASDAGFRIPEIGRYLGVIGLYVLVVGPLTYLVLGRLGRRSLAWVVVPALAGVVTVGIALFGEDLRSRNSNAHATLFEITPEGTRASSQVLVSSRSGGTTTVSGPDGWIAEMHDSFGFEMMGMPTPDVDVVDAPGRTDVELDLDPGEFQLVSLGGPVAGEPLLEIQARAVDGDTVTGTVTNNSDAAVHEVGIFIEDLGDNVGTIEAGETLEFSFEDASAQYDTGADARVWDIFEDPWSNGDLQLDEWGRPVGAVGGLEGGAVSPGLWLERINRDKWNLRPFGEVVVVGWTRGLASPLAQDGIPIAAGRAALVARAPIEPGATLGPLNAVRELVIEEADAEVIVRLQLPTSLDGEPVDPDHLVLEVPQTLRGAELFHGDGWSSLVAGFERRVVRLDADSVHAGALFVRVTPYQGLRTHNPRVDDDRELVVRELVDGEETQSLAALAAQAEWFETTDAPASLPASGSASGPTAAAPAGAGPTTTVLGGGDP